MYVYEKQVEFKASWHSNLITEDSDLNPVIA